MKICNEFGRVLQVAVQKNDRIPCRYFSAAGKSVLWAEITRMVDDDHILVLARQFRQHCAGIVRAAVVNKDNLVIHVDFFKDGLQARVHDGNSRFIPVDSDDGA